MPVGWVKYLFGCCFLLALGVGLAGYFAWKQAQKSFSADPVRVATRAAELIPGARPPAGYRGKLLMEVDGFQIVSFLPQSGPAGTSLTLMRFPLKGQTPERARQEALTAYHRRGDHRTRELSSRPVTLKMGGRPFEALEHKMDTQGMATLQYTIVATRPGDREHIVLILCSGPEQGFDHKATDAFLADLKLDPVLEASPTPKGF